MEEHATDTGVADQYTTYMHMSQKSRQSDIKTNKRQTLTHLWRVIQAPRLYINSYITAILFYERATQQAACPSRTYSYICRHKCNEADTDLYTERLIE